MTYFIYKLEQFKLQAGYEHVSMYRNNGENWFLVRTENDIAAIEALNGVTPLIIGVATDVEITAKIPNLLTEKRARIRAIGAGKLTAIAGEYMSEERETWEQQRQEAEAYLADQYAEVPMLTSFAMARGVDIITLAQGIAANAALFKIASGEVLGEMYALLDQVTAATDLQTALMLIGARWHR
ncbi:hypothetical protein THIOSC15_990005 [uncultured Thiomicrorhabdus sp.]